jgi:hypothetical protein
LQIQKFFGGIGRIYFEPKTDSVRFRFNKLTDLKNFILPHFEKYKLLTQKAADFILLKKIVEIMLIKGHISSEGIQKIINIKAVMNNGLTYELKTNFPKYKPIERPFIIIKKYS